MIKVEAHLLNILASTSTCTSTQFLKARDTLLGIPTIKICLLCKSCANKKKINLTMNQV